MSARIPDSKFPRIVIIGAGFAGLRLARKLAGKPYQVVVLDRHNFHQFQPLFYQVATAGLAPSAIAFPVRKVFHNTDNVLFRVAHVENVDVTARSVHTDIGAIEYDRLVLAIGADTNYFGNQSIEEHAFPMKSIEESLHLRNRILQCLEEALITDDEKEREAYMNVVIVGGGPTGVELAGALSEMKSYVLPKDYPELDFDRMHISLLEASERLLSTMSEKSSEAAKRFLTKMGVEVRTGSKVLSYDGMETQVEGQDTLINKTLIWAAGVRGNSLPGIPENHVLRNGRIKTNEINEVEGLQHVYAIGDLAYMETKGFERGHPQVAQVAIQQADNLAKNLVGETKGLPSKPFRYSDLGSMATIGRSKAVVDLPFYHFQGFFAWLFWLFVHLMNILGVKNKFFIFVDWLWYYISFDQSLRLVIKPKADKKKQHT